MTEEVLDLSDDNTGPDRGAGEAGAAVQELERDQDQARDPSQDHEKAKDDEESDQEETQRARDEKLKKLGKLCHSLGLQPKRMTDQMLSTIEMSKDIERDQRNVISKLNSAASLGPQDEADDDDCTANPDDDDEDTSILQVDENNQLHSSKSKKLAELRSTSKSLRRKRIPPPLSINDTTESAMYTGSSASSAASSARNCAMYPKSAPANVPNFPRSTFQNRTQFIGKPRVQYLGKVSNGFTRQQQSGYKLKTPFVPYFSRLPPPPPFQQQLQPPIPTMPHTSMAAHYPYYPYMYPNYQPPAYSTPALARSAVPYSSQTQYYQDNESLKRRYRQAQSNMGLKKAKISEDKPGDLREKEKDKTKSNDSEPLSSTNGEETRASNPDEEGETTEIPIEDSTSSNLIEAPPSPIMGEIRILGNVFSFEFPVNDPSIDKKMFLSICNSVWDKSEELAKSAQ